MSTVAPGCRTAPPQKCFGQALREQIDRLHPWFYEVRIGDQRVTPGVGTPVSASYLVGRHRYRYKLLVDAVVQRYDFSAKRVLDVACNCGYWAARYAEHGATGFLGVEARPQAVQQGWVYWQHGRFLAPGTYNFLNGNVMDERVWETVRAASPFDFTICCGILYHVSDYRRLLDNVAAVTNEAILVDTRVEPEETPVEEPGDLQFNGVPEPDAEAIVKVVPRLDLLTGHLNALGFDVECIQPEGTVPHGLTGKDDYNAGKRVTLLAQRRS